jgi:glutaredoxin
VTTSPSARVAPPPARVVVLTRAGCHLCADACEVVASVAAELGADWTTQDVDADADLRARWGEYVPVLIVDGAVLDWFRVDPDRLRRALSSSPLS